MKNISFKLILVLSSLFLNFNNTFCAVRSDLQKKLQMKRIEKAANNTIKDMEQCTQDFIKEYNEGNIQKALNIAKQKELYLARVYNLVFRNGWDDRYTNQFIKLFVERGLLKNIDNTLILHDVHDPKILTELLKRGLIPNSSLDFSPIEQRIKFCFMNQSSPGVFINTQEMILKLLDSNVNINFKSKLKGNTALTFLAEFTKDKAKTAQAIEAIKTITKDLLNSGANAKAANNERQTIFSINNPHVIQAVTEYYNVHKPQELKSLNEITKEEQTNTILTNFERSIIILDLENAKSIIEQNTHIKGNEYHTRKRGFTFLDSLAYNWHVEPSDPRAETFHEILNIFVKRGADLNLKNLLGSTPLFYATPFAIEAFLKAGANPNVKNDNLETPLLFFASNLNSISNNEVIDIIVALLKGGANPDITNSKGKTIFTIENRVALESPIVVNALKEYYATYNPQAIKEFQERIQPFELLQIQKIKEDICNGDLEQAKLKIQQNMCINGNEVARLERDNCLTILDILVQHWTHSNPHSTAIFKIFLERGVNLDSLNSEGNPAIFYATPFATQTLIRYGANPDATTIDGLSLLDVMANIANHTSDKKLVNTLADKTLILLKTKQSLTPAIKAPNKEIQNFIKNGGKFAQFVMAMKNLHLIVESNRTKIDLD